MEPPLLLQSIIQNWPIDKFVLYARNPRENDAVVDRMWSSISKFGFKIPFPALPRIYATEYTQPLVSPVQRNCGQEFDHLIHQ